jgi:hypothetical protein
MNFDLKEAIRIANQVISAKARRNLTDVEVLVLTGAWNREEYDQTAAKHQYATSYISQDVAPKLWRTLSEALGEKVKKSNFKEALKRHWEQQLLLEKELPQSFTIVTQNSGSEPSSSVDSGVSIEDILDADYYVERPPIESICYETLLQPGALVRVKAAMLMGKTFLVNRILAQVAAQNYRTVHLSFELADRKIHFTNLDKFLRWFCINLSRELSLPNQLDDYWDEDGMGSKVSCTTYFEEYLLAQDNRPLALCLDDVDLIFPYPEVYEDFFGLLRSWYEKARSRQNWKKLRLIIVHSTDVYIRLNINQSPFNVGLPIELSEFTHEQVQTFAQQHELPKDTPLILPLLQLVGGHPYLLEQAFSYLKNHPDVTLTQFLQEAPTEAGIYAGHLREHWLSLQQQPTLTEALKTVIKSTQPIVLDPIPAYQLQSMGLVKLMGNQAEVRCDLYRQYFRSRLKDLE